MLDFIQNRSVYIKVFSQQKPNPNQNVSSLSTKEYFEKKHEDAANSISGKMPFKVFNHIIYLPFFYNNFINLKTIDPEIQKLRDELHFYKMKEMQAQKRIVIKIFFN